MTYGLRIIKHADDLDGFSTKSAYCPDNQITFLVTGNQTSPERVNAVDEIAGKFVAVILGRPVEFPSERREITLATGLLSKYCGTHAVRLGFNFSLTLEADYMK